MQALSDFIKKLILSKKFLWIFFAVVIFVTMMLVFFFYPLPSTGDDSQNFWLMGNNLAKEMTYKIPRDNASFYPPGYPFFLGGLFYLFGASNFIIQLANAFLYVGSLFLIYLISKTLFQSECSARITLLVLAFHPSQIFFILWTANENLFLFIFLLGTYCLLQGEKYLKFTLLGGFIFGIACLIKPQSLFLPFVYFLSKIIWQKKAKSNFRKIALVYAVLLFTLIPWTIRNYLVHNDFVYISTQGGLDCLQRPIQTQTELLNIIKQCQNYGKNMTPYQMSQKKIDGLFKNL